jgi:hypothetical protein
VRALSFGSAAAVKGYPFERLGQEQDLAAAEYPENTRCHALLRLGISSENRDGRK